MGPVSTALSVPRTIEFNDSIARFQTWFVFELALMFWDSPQCTPRYLDLHGGSAHAGIVFKAGRPSISWAMRWRRICGGRNGTALAGGARMSPHRPRHVSHAPAAMRVRRPAAPCGASQGVVGPRALRDIPQSLVCLTRIAGPGDRRLASPPVIAFVAFASRKGSVSGVSLFGAIVFRCAAAASRVCRQGIGQRRNSLLARFVVVPPVGLWRREGRGAFREASWGRAASRGLSQKLQAPRGASPGVVAPRPPRRRQRSSGPLCRRR